MMIALLLIQYLLVLLLHTHGSTIPNRLQVTDTSRLGATNSPFSRSQFSGRRYQHFQLKKFKNSTNVRCNDGSVPGYYIRLASSKCSRKWLIYLEGGWYCFDNGSCTSRKGSHYDLFSSEFWSSERQLGGILSSNVRINPGFHDYNAVYIPYCSNDLWSGKKVKKTNGLYFHGSRIIDAVVTSLSKNSRFKQVQSLDFIGSSAGGIGVMLNIDRISRRIKKLLNRQIPIVGIVDSAWLLDYPTQRPSNCSNMYSCSIETALRKGVKLWSPRLPKRCKRSLGRAGEWKCFMGHVIYQHLKSPVFVIQSLFDDAQLQISKVPILEGGSNQKFSYIQQLGGLVAQSLKQVKGLFAHSCVGHEILTKNNWAYLSVSDQCLHETLAHWKVSVTAKIRRTKRKLFSSGKRHGRGCPNSERSAQPSRAQSSLQLQVIDSCHANEASESTGSSSGNETDSRCVDAVPLIPLCNPSCTAPSHPVSGLKMSFIDLLELYNVRIDLIVRSFGISMADLRNMSTQQQISLLYCSNR